MRLIEIILKKDAILVAYHEYSNAKFRDKFSRYNYYDIFEKMSFYIFLYLTFSIF